MLGNPRRNAGFAQLSRARLVARCRLRGFGFVGLGSWRPKSPHDLTCELWEWGLGVFEEKGPRTGYCQRALVALRTGSRVPLVVVVPDTAVRALLALALAVLVPLALVRCAGVLCKP